MVIFVKIPHHETTEANHKAACSCYMYTKRQEAVISPIFADMVRNYLLRHAGTTKGCAAKIRLFATIAQSVCPQI